MKGLDAYYYRRDNHLCVKCGEALPEGYTLKMCEICRKFTQVKQRMRYAQWSDERKARSKAYHQKWWKEHPEAMAKYRMARKTREASGDIL